MDGEVKGGGRWGGEGRGVDGEVKGGGRWGGEGRG